MLMGLHLNTLAEALQPRNPHNGHVWEHPPVIILRTLHDEDSVIERVNRTLIALHNQATLLSPQAGSINEFSLLCFQYF